MDKLLLYMTLTAVFLFGCINGFAVGVSYKSQRDHQALERALQELHQDFVYASAYMPALIIQDEED